MHLIRTADRNTTCSVTVADQSLSRVLCSFRGGSASLVGMKRRPVTVADQSLSRVLCSFRGGSASVVGMKRRPVTVADQSLSRVLCSFRGGSASLVGMKRRRDTQSEVGNVKMRVTHDTFVKWKRDLDRECQTMTWLNCETGMESGKKIVDNLKCTVYRVCR